MESVLSILSYVFWVILAIMILVFVHEMGHFLFAKLFKMRVDRFSVGFPPKIIGKTIGETEYVIGATPLGGYVKIAGMVDESMDTETLASEPQPWEFRSKPVWQRIVVITAGVVFNVLLAFVIFAALKLSYGEDYVPAENVKGVYVDAESIAHNMGLRTGDRILAVNGKQMERYGDWADVDALLADPMTITVERDGEHLTFEGPEDIMTQLNRAGGQGLGITADPTIVGGILEKSPASEVGLQAGDRIVSIGGVSVQFWSEMTRQIQASRGEPVVIRWIRPDSLNGPSEQQAQTGVPVPVSRPDSLDASAQSGSDVSVPNRFAHKDGYVYEATVAPRKYYADDDQFYLGIERPTNAMIAQEFGVRHKAYGLGGAVAAGAQETWTNMKAIVTSLRRIATGRENFRENVGGPIMISKVTKQAAEAGAEYFWGIVAVLSITLAIMNILPIPALDGGHLVFLLYEGITRREPSMKVRMAMQQVGMILLLVLMTFLIFNDILRL